MRGMCEGVSDVWTIPAADHAIGSARRKEDLKRPNR